jgi:ribonuclease-3
VTAAREIVTRLFASSLAAAATSNGQRDYKTELQELVQSLYAAPPIYEQLSAEGPDHNRAFTYQVVVNGSAAGTGSGGSKKSAQQAAAREALAALKK